MEKLRSLYDTLAVVEVKPSDWLNIRTSLLLFRCLFGSNCLIVSPTPKKVTWQQTCQQWCGQSCGHSLQSWSGDVDGIICEWVHFCFLCVCVCVCTLTCQVCSDGSGAGVGAGEGGWKKKKKKWEGVGAGGWGGSGTKSLFGLFCFSLCTFFIGKIR